MQTKRAIGSVLILAGVLATVAGCVGYSTYPRVEGLAPSSPNFIHVKPVVTEALRAVIERYHPEGAGAYAVNLPARMTEVARREILLELDAQASPLTHRTEHLPIYHVGRVWIRGTRAKVDVIRPVLELGSGSSAERAYQGVTVWLEGGLNDWAVEMIQPWSIGVVEPPALNYVDEGTEG